MAADEGFVDYVTTYVEMTSPADLRPADEVAAVQLLPVAKDAPVVKQILDRIGTPHGWDEVSWSAQRWSEHVAKPALQHWLITVDGRTAGLLGVQAQPGGSAEITCFGLVPEEVGHGYGGAALTQAVRLAWSRPPVDAEPIARVFLHTSTLDHAHALTNYRRRGFRPYRTEPGRKPVPNGPAVTSG